MGEVDLNELRASGGQPAQAMVTEAKSGKKWKEDPSQIVWKVTLNVRPEGAAPFKAVIQAPFPASEGGPSLGRLIGVVYDPHDHKRLAIDPTAQTATFGQMQAGLQQHIVEESLSRGTGGAVFMGGKWITGGPPGQAASPAAPAPAAGSSSLAGELEKLASLRDQGALTEAEFQAQKAKLLGT